MVYKFDDYYLPCKFDDYYMPCKFDDYYMKFDDYYMPCESRYKKKYTETELIRLFEILNELDIKKQTKSSTLSTPSTSSSSSLTQTENNEFSLDDAHKQFETFMNNEQNSTKQGETIKPIKSSSNISIDTIDTNIINDEKDNFAGWEYSRCIARFEELKILYNQMCEGFDGLLDFTTETEAKIKQDYMELKEKLLNWIDD